MRMPEVFLSSGILILSNPYIQVIPPSTGSTAFTVTPLAPHSAAKALV